MLKKNTFKEKAAKGNVCVVAMLSIASPPLAEVLAMSGSDAIILEAEHAPMNEAQIEDVVRACEIGGAPPLCRVPGIDPAFILRVLDAGIMGVVVPHIRTADDAAAVVAAVKYPPMGHRGSGTARAAGYGAISRDTYVAAANAETMVILMIEEPEAVDHIEAIAAVDGVDCLFIGRGDLSLTLGVKPSDPTLEAMVDQVLAAAGACGLPVMVAAGEDEARHWIDRGAQIISLQATGFLRRHWADAVRRVKAETR